MGPRRRRPADLTVSDDSELNSFQIPKTLTRGHGSIFERTSIQIPIRWVFGQCNRTLSSLIAVASTLTRDY